MEAVVATFRVADTVPPEASVTLTLLAVVIELDKVNVGPLATIGEIVVVRFRFPAKLFRLVNVIVEELVKPKGTKSEEGLATMVKSGTVMMMLSATEWMRTGVTLLAFTTSP